MEKRLSKKQKGFIADYIKTGNGTHSALKNYDTDDENVAGVIASQNLGKVKIQNAIKSLADRIPDDLLERVHLEGLEASNDIIAQGHIIATVPDYAVRHKYMDSAYKLKGVYAPEKSINLDIQANIADPRALELAKEYDEKIKKGL